MTKRKVGIGLSLALALSLVASLALGHHGQVTGGADCERWSVTATIFETTPDRRVVVETTIPGTTGVDTTGLSAGQSGLVVFTASGNSPVSGTVTLSIFTPKGHLENQSSLKIESPSDCEKETPTPTPSPTPTPTPTETPRPTLPNTAMDGS